MTDQLTWSHAGGKLRELGPEKLSDAELLAILIGTGIKDKSAEEIANQIIKKFGSLRGMAHHPADLLLDIKGMGDVKTIRIVAAFEVARRILKEASDDQEE